MKRSKAAKLELATTSIQHCRLCGSKLFTTEAMALGMHESCWRKMRRGVLYYLTNGLFTGLEDTVEGFNIERLGEGVDRWQRELAMRRAVRLGRLTEYLAACEHSEGRV